MIPGLQLTHAGSGLDSELGGVLLGGVLYARDWQGLVLVMAVVFVVVLGWGYVGLPGSRMLRALALGLKVVGIGILLVCLLEPLLPRPVAKPGANLFAVVVDNSLGLRLRDRDATQTRAEQVMSALTNREPDWAARLEEQFQVRRYLFDTRLGNVSDFAELRFDGRATAMAGALGSLAERYRGQPLAGVLLFTDGNATDVAEGKWAMAGLPPVYPVVVGQEGVVRDVAVDQVRVTQTVFEDSPVTVQADVTVDGYASKTVLTRLLDAEGKTVAEERGRVSGERGQITVRIRFQPTASGVSFYRLRSAVEQDWDQFEQPDKSGEATLENNTRQLVVDRGRGPYRVLYVGGRPNWEFKFLNRAVTEDAEVRLAALIRVAKREPRFEFRGRAGESSNPLFRGFGNQSPDDVERYDQPVLIRLNTRDAAELAGGFPKVAEDLFEYQALIVDDLESAFFTRDQMSLVHRFVSERGGGLLMLGGVDTFHEGGYLHTPIGELLPVYLDLSPGAGAASAAPPVRWGLTREGWLQPWLRVRSEEAAERIRLEGMPDFLVWNEVRGVKPGASILATARDAQGKQHPALISQRFGQGRVLAIPVGDLWRWGLREPAAREDLDRMWRQMIRWLIADVPAQVELVAEAVPGSTGQEKALRVRVRDRLYQPKENAGVRLELRPSGGNSTNVLMLRGEPSMEEAGLYQTRFMSREAGAFLAEAVVADETGKEMGRAQAGWVSDPLAEEFKSSQPNRALMAELAKQTGGEMVDLKELSGLVDRLPRRAAPITEFENMPLWHQPWVFFLALSCLLAEWGLRRWKGLP